MRRADTAIAGALVLAVIAYSTYQKEQILASGRVVLFELAPIDPRSLMQGDHMALRFALQLAVSAHGAEKDGTLIAALDENGVANFSRLDNGDPLAPNEIRIFYRVRNRDVKLGTNAFFFQEGDADLYKDARYGEVRVDSNGQILLTGLRNRDRQPLGRTAK